MSTHGVTATVFSTIPRSDFYTFQSYQYHLDPSYVHHNIGTLYEALWNFFRAWKNKYISKFYQEWRQKVCRWGGRTFFFMARPLLLASLLLLSMEAALRRGDFPFFPPSGFSIHQELFPVPSFWMRTKRLCSDRLCLMEFCAGRKTKTQMKGGHARMDSKVTTQQCVHF